MAEFNLTNSGFTPSSAFKTFAHYARFNAIQKRKSSLFLSRHHFQRRKIRFQISFHHSIKK